MMALIPAVRFGSASETQSQHVSPGRRIAFNADQRFGFAFSETPSRTAILRMVSGGRFIRTAIVSNDFPEAANFIKTTILRERPAAFRSPGPLL
jgi:hypothetical protein